MAPGASARQALADNALNTLTYTIERIPATDTRITTSAGDPTLPIPVAAPP